MKLIRPLSYFDLVIHGYGAASRYFTGKYQREYIMGIYTRSGEAARGYLFLTEREALLVPEQSVDGLVRGVYRLEQTDTIDLVPAGDLKLLSSTKTGYSRELSLAVSTSHPVAFVTINGRYHLLDGISLAPNGASIFRFNILTHYFVEKGYVEKQQHLVDALRSVSRGGSFDFSVSLGGIDAILSRRLVTAILAFVAFFALILYAAITRGSR